MQFVSTGSKSCLNFLSSRVVKCVCSSISPASKVPSQTVRQMETFNLSGSPSQRHILVTRRVPIVGIELLKSAGFAIHQWNKDDPIPRSELLKYARDIDGLFCLLTDIVDQELLEEGCPRLKVVGTMSVGYDHIDIQQCKLKGIRVGYTPDVLTHATAELTVALLLATSRRIAEGVNAVKEGNWGTWKPTWMCGPSLYGSTIGICGFGRIGRQVALNLSGFGVRRFIYSTQSSSQSELTHIGESQLQKVSFDELLHESDFLVVCCSLNDSTRHLFSTSSFSKMKKTAILINTSRGAIVDMDALANSLESGEIYAAGLDVTDPEPLPTSHRLLSISNCTVLPHIGSATIEARSAMSELTAKNIISALNEQTMPAEL